MILGIVLCLSYKNPLWGIIVQIVNAARLSHLKSQVKAAGRIYIQFPITITAPSEVELGDRVSFGAYVHIWGEGGVKIGSRVMVGTHTSISSLTHDYSTPIMFDSIVKKSVIIEDDVWIGSNCVILAGIHIGQGAVVGAGAVVTKNILANHIVAGVPAKTIGVRRLT